MNLSDLGQRMADAVIEQNPISASPVGPPDIVALAFALIDSELDAILDGEDVRTTRTYHNRAADMLRHLNEGGWFLVQQHEIKR